MGLTKENVYNVLHSLTLIKRFGVDYTLDSFLGDIGENNIEIEETCDYFSTIYLIKENGEKLKIAKDGHDPEQQAAEEAAARKRQEIRDLTVKAIMEGE